MDQVDVVRLERALHEQHQRLERLEVDRRRWRRQVARWRGAAAAAVALAGGLVLMGQSGDGRTLEAERFKLVDRGGTLRAELLVRNERPHLVFYDGAGKVRLHARTTEDGDGSLAFFDPEGNVRIVLGHRAGGGGTLVMKDGQGTIRTTLEGGGDGEGGTSLILQDSKGQPLVIQGVSRNGAPIVALRDGTNTMRSSWNVGPDGAAALKFYDASGKPVRQLSATD